MLNKWILFFIIIFSSLFLYGTTNNSIIGKIVTADGGPLCDVKVILKGSKIPALIKFTSKKGKYIFHNLPSGKYKLTTQKESYPLEKREINVCCGIILQIEFKLERLTPGYFPKLRYTCQMIDIRSSETTYCWTRETINKLPKK